MDTLALGITVFIVVMSVAGYWLLIRELFITRCDKDGTIMVEGTLDHRICPKCKQVKHIK